MFWRIGLAGFGLIAVLLTCRSAVGYTPESPAVKKAVQRAVAYLRSNYKEDTRPGAQALVGLVLLKHHAKPNDPLLQRIVSDLKAVKADVKREEVKPDVYSTGLVIIFFVTYDHGRYHNEIEFFLEYLYRQQKQHGGWGYEGSKTGDTSMTQYGVLSSWEAKQTGFAIPRDSMVRVTRWLLRTQDPGGGFGYQGRIAPEGSLVEQKEVRISLTAAGVGCLYMLSHLLELEVYEQRDRDVPGALREVVVKEPEKPGKRPPSVIDLSRFRETRNRAIRWMETHSEIDPENIYIHYYLYALERYMSLRERFENTAEKEPEWYNKGVKYLLSTQDKDGSWKSYCGFNPDTAFGALFLMRSMQKSIEKAEGFGAGTLVGGRGLPKETDRVTVRGGQVMANSQIRSLEELLTLLEDSESEELDEKVATLAELPSQQIESLLAAHGAKLRGLTKRQSPEARLAAVRAMGKTRHLDNVPALIYALSDTEPEIVLQAAEALRRIRRHPTGFGLPRGFSELQRENAIQNWKAWYRSLRPEADIDF